MNNPQGCTHGYFRSEVAMVDGNVPIQIIRCSQCGTAVGAIDARIPDALNEIGMGINKLGEMVSAIK